MIKTRDDRHLYRTVQVLNPHTGEWYDNTRRVRPATAEAILANLQHFNHTARIVGNLYYKGVFAPQLEPR